MSHFPLNLSGLSIPAQGEYHIGFDVANLTVYNNTPAQIAILETLPLPGTFPFGGIVIPAGYPMSFPVNNWHSFAYVTDGTGMFAGSSLTVFADSESSGGGGSILGPPFGASGWNAGAVPNALTAVNPGDHLFAWQVQQIINLLTGVMTSQVVVIANVLAINGPLAQLTLYNRDDQAKFFAWYANASLAHLYSSQSGADVMTVSPTGLLTVAGAAIGGSVQVLGAAGTFSFANRDDATKYFAWYANASLAHLYSSQAGRDVLTVDPTGVLAAVAAVLSGALSAASLQAGTQAPPTNGLGVQGRITAPAVGASGKTLLNRVYLAQPIPQTTTSGTGPQAQTALTLSGLPASAVAAVLLIQLSGVSLPANASLTVGPHGYTTYNLDASVPVTGQYSWETGTTTVIAGSTNQVDYQIAGVGVGGAWSATFALIAYDEPA
jgi:hypothetical protein